MATFKDYQKVPERSRFKKTFIFLNKVNERFSSDWKAKASFDILMRNFLETDISISQFLAQLQTVLTGHADLAIDFNAFLPSKCHFVIRDNQIYLPNFPSTSTNLETLKTDYENKSHLDAEFLPGLVKYLSVNKCQIDEVVFNEVSPAENNNDGETCNQNVLTDLPGEKFSKAIGIAEKRYPIGFPVESAEASNFEIRNKSGLTELPVQNVFENKTEVPTMLEVARLLLKIKKNYFSTWNDIDLEFENDKNLPGFPDEKSDNYCVEFKTLNNSDNEDGHFHEKQAKNITKEDDLWEKDNIKSGNKFGAPVECEQNVTSVDNVASRLRNVDLAASDCPGAQMFTFGQSGEKSHTISYEETKNLCNFALNFLESTSQRAKIRSKSCSDALEEERSLETTSHKYKSTEVYV